MKLRMKGCVPPLPLLLLVVLSSLLAGAAGRISRARRIKRQDYTNPYSSDPLAGRSSSNLSPVFPYVHTYNNGVFVEPGDDTGFNGFINVPIPSWGLFDISGSTSVGLTPAIWGYGHLFNPVDPLNLGPQAVSRLTADADFNQARDASDSIPVARLPGGFDPLSCKPPFCNPFVQTIGVGLENDGGGNAEISGDLDFPIPAGANGLGVRFPLDGGLSYGASNTVVNYGHNLSPIDALAAALAKQEAREKKEQRELYRNFAEASRAVQNAQRKGQRGGPARARVPVHAVPVRTESVRLPVLPPIPASFRRFARHR